MSKKLESRNDLLSCWVEKGAKMGEENLVIIKYIGDYHIEHTFTDGQVGYTTIYSLLYSPESNFFEVMFPTNGVGPLSAKTSCVLSPDPLSFLLSTLNETTS